MAKILKEMPRQKRVRKYTYPWDIWTDGQVRQVEKGEDYKTTKMAFVVQCQFAARQRNLKFTYVTIDEAAGVLAIQFIKKPRRSKKRGSSADSN